MMSNESSGWGTSPFAGPRGAEAVGAGHDEAALSCRFERKPIFEDVERWFARLRLDDYRT